MMDGKNKYSVSHQSIREIYFLEATFARKRFTSFDRTFRSRYLIKQRCSGIWLWRNYEYRGHVSGSRRTVVDTRSLALKGPDIVYYYKVV